MKTLDVIVIGAGPAGLTAAIYLQRAGYSALVLEATAYGGQMANTPEVANYPATGKISGFDLSVNWYNQAVDQGAQIEFDGVARVELSGNRKRVFTHSGLEYEASAIIIANGVKRRLLDIPGEELFSGRGVSYCATCDGGFFRSKSVVVVGGGNTAVEDALYLSKLCSQVKLLHRRDSLRAVRALSDALNARDNISVYYDTIPLEILANENGSAVGKIRVKNRKTDAEDTLDTSAVFVAIGLSPDNTLFADSLELDGGGYIIAGEDTKTNLAGVFAAGDTRTKALRQIVTAAGDGAQAAVAAGNFLTLGK